MERLKNMEKFKIHFEENKLEELYKKIEEARLPKATIKNKNYNLGRVRRKVCVN